MIHPYSHLYLNDAKQNLGAMFDYGIRGLNYSADEFFSHFIFSKVAEKFAHGNPRYVCGLSGIELANKVVSITEDKIPELVTIDTRSDGAEFWLGWTLAHFQWETALSFSEIFENGLTASIILEKYILHEADISKFIDFGKKLIRENLKKSDTKLKKIRLSRNMTQKELAERSGVKLRMIQLYEQRQNDINKASGETINNLAKGLCCNFYDLFEIDF